MNAIAEARGMIRRGARFSRSFSRNANRFDGDAKRNRCRRAIVEYFGEPIYTYSLKQGIDDGFLAPYRVIRITLDIDAEGWRPPKGFKDKDGNPVEDRIYNRSDFDRNLLSKNGGE